MVSKFNGRSLSAFSWGELLSAFFIGEVTLCIFNGRSLSAFSWGELLSAFLMGIWRDHSLHF
jgi:hypothetical protein